MIFRKSFTARRQQRCVPLRSQEQDDRRTAYRRDCHVCSGRDDDDHDDHDGDDNGDAIVLILYEILSGSSLLTRSQSTVQLARELDKRSVRRIPPIIITIATVSLSKKRSNLNCCDENR